MDRRALPIPFAMASRSRLRQLFAYLRPHWKQTSLGIVALLIVNILAVTLPRIIGSCVDEIRLADSIELDRFIQYSLQVLGLASIMLVIRLSSRQLIFGVGRKVEFDLKQRIFQHLLTMEPAYFSENTIGDLINRATSDVDNIRRLLGFAVLSLINTMLAYLFVLPAMMTLHFRLSVLAIAVYPIMLTTVQLFSHKLRTQQENVQENLSDMSELIQEDMSGIGLIKIYAQEQNERRAFGRRNQQLLNANLTLAKTRNFLFPLLEGLTSLSLLVILWMGSRAIAAGTLTVGNFVTLILYVQQLVFPTALLGFTITAYQRGEVSVDRVEAILQEDAKIQNPPDAQPLERSQVRGHLKADRLNFSYPGAASPSLDQVSFVIEPHQTVAVVGPIGAGKSTLANAIPRLLDIESGQLYLDGMDVTQIGLEDLRGAIAYVPQDSFLFSSTIRDNIRYGDPLKEQPVVERAAVQAQIHPEIENFPQHYDTLVGERGITLSGGQRQRTALSRALLVDAPILILDDALSSVDNQTATQILRELSTGTQRKTVIFISHQMSAAASADVILVMDQGRIVQSGTHSELMKQEGLYRSLWERQQLEAQLN